MKNVRSTPDLPNTFVVAVQLLVICSCIAACTMVRGWWWIALGAAFVLTMNSVYFAIHEAEHGLLFSNRRINDAVGTALALFLPASYTFIRNVHLAHHIHNRSDEEVFDVYSDDDPAWWKKLQFFGILTGGFWLTLVMGNLAFAVIPMRWLSRAAQIDRPSAAVMKYVNRHNRWRIRAEAWMVLILHSTIAWWLGAWAIRYAMIYAAFGVSWSTLQYVHHYGTCRDVLRGAKNLRYGRVLDVLWLNHGWHLTHHLHPTVSWLHLQQITGDDEPRTESLGRAYLKMWRGPILTREHVKNRYDGIVAQYQR
jgi:fatty acid desaturase